MELNPLSALGSPADFREERRLNAASLPTILESPAAAPMVNTSRLWSPSLDDSLTNPLDQPMSPFSLDQPGSPPDVSIEPLSPNTPMLLSLGTQTPPTASTESSATPLAFAPDSPSPVDTGTFPLESDSPSPVETGTPLESETSSDTFSVASETTSQPSPRSAEGMPSTVPPLVSYQFEQSLQPDEASEEDLSPIFEGDITPIVQPDIKVPRQSETTFAPSSSEPFEASPSEPSEVSLSEPLGPSASEPFRPSLSDLLEASSRFPNFMGKVAVDRGTLSLDVSVGNDTIILKVPVGPGNLSIRHGNTSSSAGMSDF